jgi:uncharacterized metal-binding protein
VPCASCKAHTCFTGKGEVPAGCPEGKRVEQDAPPPFEKFAVHTKAVQEKSVDRIHEVIEHAKFMGYKKIGIAGCIGMHDELRVITQMLRKDGGLEVSSVMCKSGSLHKKKLGVPSKYRLTTRTGYGIGVIACNPVAQALVFNDEETDMNCILGLCVGHDSIFMKHSKAPTISLIVKDRSNAHNPASILYGFYGDNFFGRRPTPQGSAEFNAKNIRLTDVLRMLKKRLGGER